MIEFLQQYFEESTITEIINMLTNAGVVIGVTAVGLILKSVGTKVLMMFTNANKEQIKQQEEFEKRCKAMNNLILIMATGLGLDSATLQHIKNAIENLDLVDSNVESTLSNAIETKVVEEKNEISEAEKLLKELEALQKVD